MRQEHGLVLIENLVAVVIFAIGVLGFIGLQAASMKASGDAKYRADAAFMASTLLGRMATDIPNLVQYANNSNGGAIAANCTPATDLSANANVTDWTATLAATLPGASAERQQIIIDSATGEVTVQICWQTPQEPTPSRYIVKAVVQ